VAKCLEDLPWTKALKEKKSEAHKLISTNAYSFSKWQGALMEMLSDMQGKQGKYSNLYNFFNNNHEILLAVLIQNCLQPKNSQRVEAIKAESYVEIDSQAAARSYLTELLKKNLEIELKKAESEIHD